MSWKAHTFEAASMAEALARVKRALGPHAVILEAHKREPRDGASGPVRFEIQAAVAPPAETTPLPSRLRPATAAPTAPATTEQAATIAAAATGAGPTPASTAPAAEPVEPGLHALFVELTQREVAAELAADLLRHAAKAAGGKTDAAALRAALCEAIARMIPIGGGVRLDGSGARRVALVGPSGAGKSSTIAKLAAQLRLRQKTSVGLLSLDNQRLACSEPLRRLAALLQVPFAEARTAAQLRRAARTLADCQVTLIDTPGVGPRDDLRMQRLGSLLASLPGCEVHLVLPASADRVAQRRAIQRFEPLGVQRVILTRLDEAVGMGTLLHVIRELGRPLSYLADGQRIPADLSEACGSRISELVLSGM
ncbi:MAG TPA: hypothetical protein PKC49_03415 [Phycisphaerae bacterium]|nr:hypothetical protein [Phycisphaerae bacterium]